jgi:hypothetical protein
MTAKETLESLAPYVPLFQTVFWIVLIAAAAILLRKQCVEIVKAIVVRIKQGSPLKAGPLELGPDLANLEYAAPRAPDASTELQHENWNAERTGIYQHNRGIFLTHVISPSHKPGQKYDIFIYLIRHKTTDFGDVEQAEFFFGHMWGNRVFLEHETNGIIGVSTSAYGPFLCTCRVSFKDNTHIQLSRYIDFEMGRAFE